MTENTRPARRAALAAVASFGLLAAAPAVAQAPVYPAPGHPIRFVVPYPPGGATDILARAVAQKLSETWKVPVVVDNKPGGGGTIGAQLVANSPADGQTVLFTIVALVQQIAMMKLPYDPLKDFVPVTRVAISPSILAVPKDTPVNDAKEFVALVKSQPGRFNYGTYGVGTSSHIQGSLLNLQGGLDMVHVPYQGAAPLINAMLGNQLSSAFLDAGSSRQHLPKFKLLGTTGTQRLSWLPDVPTLKEQGLVGFEPMGWFGLLLPAGASKAVVSKFSEECLRILRSAEMTERIEGMGLVPGGDTPEQFAQVMKEEAAAYARIIKDADIRLN